MGYRLHQYVARGTGFYRNTCCTRHRSSLTFKIHLDYDTSTWPVFYRIGVYRSSLTFKIHLEYDRISTTQLVYVARVFPIGVENDYYQQITGGSDRISTTPVRGQRYWLLQEYLQYSPSIVLDLLNPPRI